MFVFQFAFHKRPHRGKGSFIWKCYRCHVFLVLCNVPHDNKFFHSNLHLLLSTFIRLYECLNYIHCTFTAPPQKKNEAKPAHFMKVLLTM